MMRMDDGTRTLLAALISGERIATLGTLRQGAPLVSMVAFLAAPDRSAFHVHVSRLAWHTQDMLQDARVSLCVAQRDDGREDPQTLARLSIRAEATQLDNAGDEYDRLKTAWLARHAAAAINFELADFHFWRLAPRDARFVAGFGRIHSLSAADLRA
ncbi:MAG: pyridoxamine 5'-phosphate oxidase family protein [Betaproteobacteria bacterium]|nr:pyridoxamine 5'-phosphate oxidase family protein [Betaproteobacteria bacterium]